MNKKTKQTNSKNKIIKMTKILCKLKIKSKNSNKSKNIEITNNPINMRIIMELKR